MHTQDLVALGFVVLVFVTVFGGITGPRHIKTHGLIVVTALFTPFVSFEWSKLGALPLEVWIFCGAFLAIQAIHTATHFLRPNAIHAHGPEILFQPLIVIWVVALRCSLDPSLWYRGHLGMFLFCLETLFLSLGVLMLNFISEGVSLSGDNVDILNDPLYSPGNSGFLTGSVTSLMLALYVVYLNPLWLLAACVIFAIARIVLAPRANPKPSEVSTAERA